MSGRSHSIGCPAMHNSSTFSPPPLNFPYFSNSTSSKTFSSGNRGSIWFWKTCIFSSQSCVVIFLLAFFKFFPWSWKKVEIYSHILLVPFSITRMINYWEAIWSIKMKYKAHPLRACGLDWLQLLWAARALWSEEQSKSRTHFRLGPL